MKDLKLFTGYQQSNLKETRFGKIVKDFYCNSLVRKIYTFVIIGLIGANLFSLMKYYTEAEELSFFEIENEDVSNEDSVEDNIFSEMGYDGDVDVDETSDLNDFGEYDELLESENDELLGIEGDSVVIDGNDMNMQILPLDILEALAETGEFDGSENEGGEIEFSNNFSDKTDYSGDQTDLLEFESSLSEGGKDETGLSDLETDEILTGKVLEITNAWKTLNKQSIYGTKVFNNVVVYVDAPIGTFPEGTKLVITPIESASVAAFDISFIYTYLDGTTEELQPKAGKEVQVKFDYANNNALLKALGEGGELKVSHIHGEDKELLDVVDKNEGNLTINMDRFSIVELELVQGLMLTTSLSVLEGGYYIINENDSDYPQGCKTPGLVEPDKYCILSMYVDNSKIGWGTCNASSTSIYCKKGNILIAPSNTEVVRSKSGGYSYCNVLNLLGMQWEIPVSHQGAWSYIMNNKNKIYNLTAQGSTKANHYWADPKEVNGINCNLDGGCGNEGVSTQLSVRCIAWEAQGRTVTFNSKGGSSVSAQVVAGGMTATEPMSTPVKGGYTFGGWYTDDGSFESEFDFSTPITADITLYAKWTCSEPGYIEDGNNCEKGVVVTLDGNGGEPDMQTTTIMSGLSLDLTQYSCTKSESVFVGWSESPDVTQPLISSQVIVGDKTFYAVYKADLNHNGIADEDEHPGLVTVHYVYTGGRGEAAPDQTGKYLSGLSFSITSPTITHYTANINPVTGIGKDEAQEFTVTYTPNRDLNHNGIADEDDEFSVTLLVDPVGYGNVSKELVTGGYMAEIVENGVTLTIGDSVILGSPADVTQEFTYAFSGWNNSCGDKLTKDCTIVAKFNRTKNKYTIIWKNSDGTVMEVDENVLYGETPNYDGETPEKAGDVRYTYEFAGWTPAVSEVTTGVTYTAIYNNIPNNYLLTIHYINTQGGSMFVDYTGSYSVGSAYNVESPVKNHYTVDKTAVIGTMGAENQEVTVTYTPDLDKNSNGISDWEEPRHLLTIHYVNTHSGTVFEDYTSSLVSGATYTVLSQMKDNYTVNRPIVSGIMGNSDVEEFVIYTAGNDINDNGIDDETENKYILTIEYKYSNGKKAYDTVTGEYLSGMSYSIVSPLNVYYKADKDVVSGIITGNNIEILVTYKPVTDVNGNLIADEEEEPGLVTVNYIYVSGSMARPSVTGVYLIGMTFSITSPTIEYYKADIDQVIGTGKDEAQTFTVIYSPVNDVNHNNIADEEENLTAQRVASSKKPERKQTKNGSSEESQTHGSAEIKEEKEVSKQGNYKGINVEKYNVNYSTEFNEAYQFSYANEITTQSTIKDAKMYTELTRIEMAKMLSQYAINVLGQTPDVSKGMIKFSDVSNKLNKEYDNAVTLAYQLGIMGINVKNNEFRPRDVVTREELVTALSRMLYNTEDGKGKVKYYEPHMIKLYNEGIINNTDGKVKEKRGYIMTMLMRASE